MKLFDEKFVHFMWDDKLAEKRVFAADAIGYLMKSVEEGDESDLWEVEYSGRLSFPFHKIGGSDVNFVYYDPNYSIKKAFNEGKTIQYQLVGEVDWRDVGDEEMFKQYIEEGRTFRIKPEEDEKWIVYFARQKGGVCYLSTCEEDKWEFVQKSYGAKTKLFVGVYGDAVKWCVSRQKFAEVIKAWEDGKEIQFRRPSKYLNWIYASDPNWNPELEYRVKPECPCADGVDSKACVGCEHSEDGKPRINKNYVEGVCKDCLERKKYRPYESSAEMIADFVNRFKVKCPSYCKPLIWVRLKVDKRRRLIVAYGDNFVEIGNKTKAVTLQHLFEQYDFLDGSPVGMEAKND